jgi:hypothetical protein
MLHLYAALAEREAAHFGARSRRSLRARLGRWARQYISTNSWRMWAFVGAGGSQGSGELRQSVEGIGALAGLSDASVSAKGRRSFAHTMKLPQSGLAQKLMSRLPTEIQEAIARLHIGPAATED